MLDRKYFRKKGKEVETDRRLLVLYISKVGERDKNVCVYIYVRVHIYICKVLKEKVDKMEKTKLEVNSLKKERLFQNIQDGDKSFESSL